MFQFHEGPIKTHRPKIPALHHTRGFNSMKVRLKHAAVGIAAMSMISFNSMKVRLKLCAPRPGTAHTAGFQFHEGPIKTSVDPRLLLGDS